MAYICPYCHLACFDDGNLTAYHYLSYEHDGILNVKSDEDSMPLRIELTKCPNCGKVSVTVESMYGKKERIPPYSFPPANVADLPEYLPTAVKNDYLEAIAVVNLSPKASATLARRCLQGMIHDFWGIREKNLNAEITSLQGKIPAAQWNAIDALRKIGNIGAHMESDINLIIDVEPDEAQKLIKLIELLIDKWYVARHDEEELFSEITAISSEKEGERKSAGTDSGSQ